MGEDFHMFRQVVVYTHFALGNKRRFYWEILDLLCNEEAENNRENKDNWEFKFDPTVIYSGVLNHP